MFSRISRVGLRRVHIGRVPGRRVNSTKSQSQGSQQGSQGQQGPKKTGIKALIQEYGYSALAVYLGLSALDYPLCFIAVHSAGEDKIRDLQDECKKLIGMTPKERPVKSDTDTDTDTDNKESIWSSTLFTEAILAYGIHKSLIFIRLPITAAITPAIVGKLRKMGFNIGSTKLSTIAQQAKTKTSQKIVDSKNAVASNKKFGTPVTKRQKWWSWFF